MAVGAPCDCWIAGRALEDFFLAADLGFEEEVFVFFPAAAAGAAAAALLVAEDAEDVLVVDAFFLGLVTVFFVTAPLVGEETLVVLGVAVEELLLELELEGVLLTRVTPEDGRADMMKNQGKMDKVVTHPKYDNSS